MLRVLSIFGTRPEAIKLAQVIRTLSARTERVVSRVCVTAQHRGMLDQMLDWFSLKADHDLDIMSPGQTSTQVAARVLAGLEAVLKEEQPDWVLVQGDTTTAAAAALAACYSRARVAHIEAGLRSHDTRNPFPEEHNRRAITSLASLHFAPTPGSKANLLAEGVEPHRVLVTGNTGIDALLHTLRTLDPRRDGLPWMHIPPDRRVIMVTAHRQENLGQPLREICSALAGIADMHADRVTIVFPVHPRPMVSRTVREMLGGRRNVILCESLDYHRSVQLMLRSDFLITDSGGLQEEAPSVGRPVLVLRTATERPEAVEAGCSILVGTCRHAILEEANRLLDDSSARDRMARRVDCYGDGRAAERIVAALLGERVDEWRTEQPDAARIE